MKTWLDFTNLLFLGESNHGLYYKATPPKRLSVDNEVVIKVLVRDSSDEQWQSVSQEIRLLNQLSSPWIVNILETGHDQGRLYYAMEYASIGTLATPSRELSMHEKVAALSHGVRGLAQLHSKGIIHRDIKPAKILVHEQGGKLNDLGIADKHQPEGDSIPTGSIGFMAPEVAKGLKATPASDIFSVGATLHLLLSEQSIYPNVPRVNLMDAVHHIATQIPIIIFDKSKPLLMGIMQECLKLDHTERTITALEIANQLDLAIDKELL
jgi:serine/threonine protein kinase